MPTPILTRELGWMNCREWTRSGLSYSRWRDNNSPYNPLEASSGASKTDFEDGCPPRDNSSPSVPAQCGE
jgi:hypothetical protein